LINHYLLKEQNESKKREEKSAGSHKKTALPEALNNFCVTVTLDSEIGPLKKKTLRWIKRDLSFKRKRKASGALSNELENLTTRTKVKAAS